MSVKPIINIDEIGTMDMAQGERFGAKLGRIGAAIGAEQLGCLLTIVEPGKSAFPFHVHHAIEEMFIILEGTGEYRFGTDIYPIRAGDVLAAPCGGAEVAHQIVNTGDKAIKYLGVSTKADPEVVEYPDSGKFLTISRLDETGLPQNAKFMFVGRKNSAVDYWDGEDTDTSAART
ncbi:MAG: cupin domain-containing protein [Fimbriimonadaceae bacterium]|nr:cupin domain-containing protein [Alphaproteobacteria bacterium]